MMDRLEAMELLVAAIDQGSLTAAGRRLGVPLPTVSRKIAELERHVGTRLLARSTRRLTLTEAGADYLAACRRILEAVGEAERAASGEQVAPKGELVVAAPIVFGRLHVLPVVSAFLAAFPEIDVRLVLSDRNADLLEDAIHVALRIGALRDSAALATRVGAVRRVVCGSPGFFAAHRVPETPQDLADLPCVTFDVLGSAGAWTFEAGDWGRPVTVALRSRLSVNTAEAARDAALAGIGVTRLLSYQVQEAVAADLLRIVLAGHEPPPLPVQLLHQPGGVPPLKLRTFLDFATPRLRARLA